MKCKSYIKSQHTPYLLGPWALAQLGIDTGIIIMVAFLLVATTRVAVGNSSRLSSDRRVKLSSSPIGWPSSFLPDLAAWIFNKASVVDASIFIEFDMSRTTILCSSDNGLNPCPDGPISVGSVYFLHRLTAWRFSRPLCLKLSNASPVDPMGTPGVLNSNSDAFVADDDGSFPFFSPTPPQKL